MSVFAMPNSQIQAEAAAFRRLVSHLQGRSDVQNIDLMNLAGFCRNCLADWYQESAQALGLNVDKNSARTLVYGMPQAEWKQKFQREVSAEQLVRFEQESRHK
jgi:hypothetical protein